MSGSGPKSGEPTSGEPTSGEPTSGEPTSGEPGPDKESAGADEPEGRDRRRHQRADVPVLVQIRYVATEAPRTVYAVNISQSGLFLDVDDGKPVGSRVFVQVTSTDGNHLLRGEGRVVRRLGGHGQQGGVGIELVGFDDAARVILQKLVGG